MSEESTECDSLNISKCMESDDEVEDPIKSVATVKHQIVRSPVNFTRLQCGIDLNIPPTNWLNSSFNSYGLQQALSQSTGFSSFRMAHLFPDCVGEVDVVSSAENIKRLLKLPYAPNSSISMMVHRVGNTLLLDEFDVHRFLLQQEDCNWQWLRSFIYENILSRLTDPERNAFGKQGAASRSEVTQQRSLLSKLLYHSFLTEENTAKPETSDQLNVDVVQPPLYLPLLPEPNIDLHVPDPKHTKHTYNRNVIWTFEDIRMLIGTDMAIFGGSTRPCISLRLRDMRQPINVLTGIDYWLDNLMCNVPEVGMYYHLDGFVQSYESIKTEDLPHLEDSKFSPNVIRNVAQSILSFLKQNATKSGHTYWLFKGRNDDVVKLYDLTSLCPTGEFGPDASHQSPSEQQQNTEESNDQNPFTVPVAMLLYKVARNMKNSSEKLSAKQAGSIKALLDNCIKLLPKEKYPQIVTSSYYLLSDLHVPTGTDPNAPKFYGDLNMSGTQSVEDDDETNNSDDGGSAHAGDEANNDYSIAVQSVVDAAKDSKSNKNWIQHNSSPPPLTGTVDERCAIALQYIANGLDCLQYFSKSEEKLSKEREEIAKQQEKIRIIQEEQNPNMARPYQAIPLPYEKLKQNLSAESKEVADKKNGDKESKSMRKNSQTVVPKKKSQAKEGEDEQQLLSKCRPPIIQSWNVHLKLLMLEKACLIYATLTEQAYQREKYGLALKFISLAIKCQHVVTKHMSSIASQKICLLGRAGDCYFQCSQRFESINTYLTQFKTSRDVDLAIQKQLKKDVETIDEDGELPTPTDNVERLILASISCYETALQCSSSTNSQFELIGRLGSVRNDLGVKYMHWSQEDYQKSLDAEKKEPGEDENAGNDPEADPVYLSLAKKSYDCFMLGIAAFEEIKDNANLAILLCNMGRFMRFRAHFNETERKFMFMEKCYEKAFASYERALGILESKKSNPNLWDWATWELSTGKFTLGKLLLDMFADKMNDEREQQIIDLLLGSLKLCDVETPGSKQIMYIIRSGLIYHNLGNIYSKAYKLETISDVRKKKLLQLARLYYEKGSKTFETIDAPVEYLAIQIDRLDLQNILFESSQTPAQKSKVLNASFEMACSLISQLLKIEKLDESSSSPAKAPLKQLEEHLQTMLKHLIKISMNKQCDASLLSDYKKLYSSTLQTPKDTKENFLLFAQHLRSVLENIRKSVISP